MITITLSLWKNWTTFNWFQNMAPDNINLEDSFGDGIFCIKNIIVDGNLYKLQRLHIKYEENNLYGPQ